MPTLAGAVDVPGNILDLLQRQHGCVLGQALGKAQNPCQRRARFARPGVMLLRRSFSQVCVFSPKAAYWASRLEIAASSSLREKGLTR